MADTLKKLSLKTHGVRYKILIAFVLMSIIPLLATLYLIAAYVPLANTGTLLEIACIFFIAAGISFLGFLLCRSIVNSVIALSVHARILANGNLEHRIDDVDCDEVGTLVQSLDVLVDQLRNTISGPKRSGDDIAGHSMKDELTGLYTMAYLMTRLDEEIELGIRYQRPCSLIVINLDNFKSYGSVHGQLAAEGAIIEIAQLIKKTVTETAEKAARLGDDEFAVLLPGKSKRFAIGLAENLRSNIEKLPLSTAKGQKITATMGVSENPLDGSNGRSLLHRARERIQEAKRSGKNRVAI
ncbi:MAG: diguanylate cyclase [Candidatus Omnitrophica bacterium]|nr:diguanylate cyclase [Candidatus Omnitrophota bacterium]